MVVSNTKEVVSKLLPFLQVYKDGTVDRFLDSPYIPPSPLGGNTRVLSKDVVITNDVSARIYLPPISTNQKLPILVYFHGGGFCIESAFSVLCHRYIDAIVSKSKIIVVSVEYRLAPENPLPAAYQDSWTALQWIASHYTTATKNSQEEPWLIHNADFNRVYLGGDSSGANIAHNIAMRAGVESLHGDMKIYGILLSHPYFLGSKLIGKENMNIERKTLEDTWNFVYPNAEGGIDNPLVNPFSNKSPSLWQLKCERLLVCVASTDELRERGVYYYNAVKESGWKGEVELFQVEGEGHGFHIFQLETEKAKHMLMRFATFLSY